MDSTNLTNHQHDLTVSELRKILVDFENSPAWDAPKDEQGKTRHLTLHLAKLLGKIGTVAERREHSIEPDLTVLKEEVIPDLLYYALSLAEAHDVDLQSAFLNRLDSNRARVQAWVEKRDGIKQSRE
jgi:hypothetical protein